MMTAFDRLLDRIGRLIAARLERPSSGHKPFAPPDTETLYRNLRPADVLLVDGNQKVSTAIKYLTQSTWSHAAIFVGTLAGQVTQQGEPLSLIEANLGDGVVAVPVSKYASFNTRICRPVSLTELEQQGVVRFALDRLGQQYDTRNIVDLARYLFPTPPVPVRWRRQMLALGSGEPTRFICSTLIAQAFQSVRYPILPTTELRPIGSTLDDNGCREILHIRHHSLFAPRDFDLSPYFEIIKPTIRSDFDHHRLLWGDMPAEKL
jgi:hypothetical protein